MEDEVVTLSEFVESENVDCQDHFVANEDSLERHLKDGEEIQRLRDRVKELERDIYIMELKLKVKSLELLQSRKTYYCSNCKEKGAEACTGLNEIFAFIDFHVVFIIKVNGGLGIIPQLSVFKIFT